MLHANNNVNVTLNFKSKNTVDRQKIAQKLHTQFVNPPASKLIKLIEEGELKDDEALKSEIKNISEICEICNIYDRSNSRPVAGLSMVTEFNQILAVDLKEFKGKLILHVIDHVARFSAATFVASKHRRNCSLAFTEVPSLKFGYLYLDHLLHSLLIIVVNLVTMTFTTCMSH